MQKGLFEDIAVGIKHCKVVVACVSRQVRIQMKQVISFKRDNTILQLYLNSSIVEQQLNFNFQYAVSTNCMMEVRFAACTMNKPIVIAVVGTDEEWQWGEVC